MLQNGRWAEDWQPIQSSDKAGRFIRQGSSFRNWITPDGAPGPEGQPALVAEPGRYQLIVGYICPWASRTLMARALKGLEAVIDVTVIKPKLTEQGWQIGEYPNSEMADILLNAKYLHELYSHCDPEYSGRATIPILWDKQNRCIVNNESADILRILDEGFGDLARHKQPLQPPALREEIHILNQELYDGLNNGVYKAGFASTQFAYQEACNQIFNLLDALESRLQDQRPYLLGQELTESDIRAFVTLIRFDAAYVGIFKTNRKRIADYPNLFAYTRRILDLPGIRETVNIDHIKAGYYSIKSLNPSGIVPEGPDLSAMGL